MDTLATPVLDAPSAGAEAPARRVSRPAPGSDAVIVLRDLVKTYSSEAGEVRAVRGVDLTIERGDFVAIMGSSGSGKSTMMNILGCLDQASSGTYLLDGVDTSELDTNELADLRNQKLGFVFQGFNLLSRTTAVENVELPLIYSTRRLSPDERADAAEHRVEPDRPGPAPRSPPERTFRRPAAARRHRPIPGQPSRLSCSPTNRPAISTARPATTS
jgi:ABC-type multidrug transport system fused ATPase/permease subunit